MAELRSRSITSSGRINKDGYYDPEFIGEVDGVNRSYTATQPMYMSIGENGETNFPIGMIRKYTGIPDMHLVPTFLFFILIVLGIFAVFFLLGILAIFNNLGKTHEIVTYMRDIATVTRGVSNATKYVQERVAKEANISLVVERSLPQNTMEWLVLETNAKRTMAAGANVIQSMNNKNLIGETAQLFKAFRLLLEKESFNEMMEKLEQFVPKIMVAMATNEAKEVYDISLTILQHIPSILDVIVPWITTDVEHAQIDQMKQLLGLFVQEEVKEGIASIGTIVSDLKDVFGVLKQIITSDDFRDSVEEIIKKLSKVDWNHVGHNVMDILIDVKTGIQSKEGTQVIDACVTLINEIAATLRSIHIYMDTGEAHHAAVEMVTLVDNVNKLVALLNNK